MEQESQSNDDVQEFVPDKPFFANQMVDEMMKALAHSEEARYKLFLKLKMEFGAGKV